MLEAVHQQRAEVSNAQRLPTLSCTGASWSSVSVQQAQAKLQSYKVQGNAHHPVGQQVNLVHECVVHCCSFA